MNNPPDETPEEKARRLGVRLIPRRTPRRLPNAPYDPNPIVSICGECGLELRQTMMYCCRRENCPTGLGGPTML